MEVVTKSLGGGNNGLVSSFKPSRFLMVDPAHIQYHAQTYASFVSESLYWLRRIIDAKDAKLTTMAIFSLFVLYILTMMVSLPSLLTILLITAFTFPPTYNRYRPEMDHAYGQISSVFGGHYSNYQGQFNTMTAPHFEKVRAAQNSIGSFFGRGGGAPVPAAAAAAAAPVPAAVAPVPVEAPPVVAAASEHAPSIRSMKAPSVKSSHSARSKAPSVRTMSAPSIRSVRSKASGMNPAMLAGGAALGGAALGAGGMALASGGSRPPSVMLPAPGAPSVYSDYGSEYSEGAYSDYTMSDGRSIAGSHVG